MGLRRLFRNCIVRNNTIPLPEETVYRVLSSRRRRQLLVALDEHDSETATIGELAEHIATLEDGDYNTVRIALYQAHLPLLDDVAVVEWDADTGVVRAGGGVSPLAEVVRRLDEQIRGADAE